MGSWKVMSTWASLARDTISESFTTWGRTDGFMNKLLHRHDNTASLSGSGVSGEWTAPWWLSGAKLSPRFITTD